MRRETWLGIAVASLLLMTGVGVTWWHRQPTPAVDVSSQDAQLLLGPLTVQLELMPRPVMALTPFTLTVRPTTLP